MDAICAVLARLAGQRDCMSYGALAAELGLHGPGRIAQLTAQLEALMEQDAARGLPLRAAVVIARGANGLPARGFFLKAQELGLDVSDPAVFHRAQLDALYSMHS